MRFMAFVKSNPDSEAGVLPTEEMLAEMGAYNEELIRLGAMLGGEGLKPSAQGKRVRIENDKARQLDGPFAETKELVGGYWLLQFASRDEAIEWLKRAPFPDGEVELRPLYEPGDFAPPGETPAAPQEPPKQARISGTTRYMSLLKADAYTEGDDQATPALLTEMGALMEEMGEQGVLLSGDGLKPSREGARIQYDGKRPRVIDGPFTESKELVAGVCVLQTRTLAQAVEWSRRMLEIHMRGVGAKTGEVEVRPMFELEDFPVNPDEKPDGWRAQEQAFRDRQ
jgi:hypothetical protein